MRQMATPVLALALGFAAALALVSCGGEDAKLLPGSTAREITENLEAVEQRAEEGDCAGAAAEAGEVSAQVDALEGVDAKLVQVLERGAARLNEVVVTCEEETTETVEPEEEATTTEEEELPPGQEKKEEKEREKEEKEQEKEEKEAEKEMPEPPPSEPPTTTAPPSEDGGTGAPGGVSPGAPAEPEDEDE
jgi:outer membrane biosynthesis protein TonB